LFCLQINGNVHGACDLEMVGAPLAVANKGIAFRQKWPLLSQVDSLVLQMATSTSGPSVSEVRRGSQREMCT
jgi:hypothetical protein